MASSPLTSGDGGHDGRGGKKRPWAV